ncbi:hypothetical protein DFA_04906 [Cavenderia fasciculata]|uniref:Uncharacterized protein n=1 Tax=Cavenderia fasciculata TaxID=261658 RepID=F4PMC6_CACFS|nr:uncharacterized protein DFA_04906 [Cavenderia fasciculata]EGG22776.1 hypothetical protein DFA_04906 [Cavenderia fasciculata]|eukprot:XP_004360627.1 hypothetical protein DFA_04906 [Cavenderia fasciculata]
MKSTKITKTQSSLDKRLLKIGLLLMVFIILQFVVCDPISISITNTSPAVIVDVSSLSPPPSSSSSSEEDTKINIINDHNNNNNNHRSSYDPATLQPCIHLCSQNYTHAKTECYSNRQGMAILLKCFSRSATDYRYCVEFCSIERDK